MITISPVPVEMVEIAWPTILPWLERSMSHSPKLYAPEDVLKLCLSKDMLLWVAVEDNKNVIGMTITTLEQYPRMLLAHIKWAGGIKHKGRDWMIQMIDAVKVWATTCGAHRIIGTGKKNWLTDDYGFKHSGVSFEMELKK